MIDPPSRSAADNALLEVTDALIRSTSRTELFEVLHRYIKKLFPDPYSSLWIVDEERPQPWLLLIDEFGNRTESLRPAHHRVAIGEGAVGQAMINQSPLLLDMQEPHHRSVLIFPQVVDDEAICQLIAIPVPAGSSVRGVLAVGLRQAHQVSAQNINHLRAVAGQVLALMLRLYQQELTQTITRSIWQLFQSGEDQYYPQKFLRSLLKVIDADWASIMVRRSSQESAVSILASIPSSENPALPVNEFFRVATKRSIRLFDVSGSSRDGELNLYGLNYQDLTEAFDSLNPAVAHGDHFMSVPFEASDETQAYSGAVIFGRHKDNFGFLRQEEELLHTSAAFLTVLTGYRQKLQTQDTMLTVAQDVAAAREIHSVVESTLLGAIKVTGAVVGFVALSDGDNEQLKLFDVYNLPGDLDIDLNQLAQPALMQNGAVEQLFVLNPPSPVLADHTPFSDPGIIEVNVPISREGHIVGMLVLGVPETKWSNDDANLQALRLFADQVGIAHSERLLADRAERFQQRIDQIASEATASLVTITLAHEVKNALNVLGVTIERLEPIAHSLRAQMIELREQRRLADRLDEVHDTIASQIMRVSDLANIVRDLTRGGSLRTPSSQTDTVYLNDVVKLWTRLLQDVAGEYGIKLHSRYDPALDCPKSGVGHPCMVNQARLGQIIINLLTNAFQASRRGGRVDVTTNLQTDADPSNRALLRVRDYGHGMDREVMQRSFDMFFSTKAKGYGLGLPVVKAIIDSFDGTIDVNSEPGKGTTFVIGIPCK